MRTILAAAALCCACCGSAAPASAALPSPTNPAGKQLGVVPAHGQASRLGLAGSNLSYHDGPVMHSNSVRAIYWIPPGYSVSSRYQLLIDGYFGNVSGAKRLDQ
jgi:hypothetical protein